MQLDMNIVIGGDYNCTLYPLLNKQSLKPLQSNIWRLTHPTDRDYSCSPVHMSYSRIDYLLLDSKLLSTVKIVTHHPIIRSDHSSWLPGALWYLYCYLMSSSLTTCKNKFPTLTLRNDTGDVSDTILWEALKAVIRGHIIAFVCNKRKRKNSRLNGYNVTFQIKKMYLRTILTKPLESITKLKYEYNTILSQRVGSLLAKTQ